MSWDKLEPIDGRFVGCLNCGYKHSVAEMDMRIAVGFGVATLSKDGEIVFEEGNKEYEDCITVEEAEAMAAIDPDHDWQIRLESALSEVVYQRHDMNMWVLVKTGGGFA